MDKHQQMGGTKDDKEMLLRRVREVDPRNAEEIVCAIQSSQPEKMKQHAEKSDEDLSSLIGKVKGSMKLNSKIEPLGPVQRPAFTGLRKQLQSSSQQGLGYSNSIKYPSSSSQPWNIHIPCCYSYNGICTRDVDCPSTSEFGLFGNLEMEIRSLLIWHRSFSVFSVLVEELPLKYFECYKKHLDVNTNFREIQWDGMSCKLSSLLQQLHTITILRDSYGQNWVFLVENAPAYHYQGWLDGADQIYITFAATSTLREIHVVNYFSHYGIVSDVQIPAVKGCHMFGFVRFLHPETVNLLLIEWNPQTAHLICGARVFAKRYKPKYERKPNEGENVTRLSHVSDGPKENTTPHNGEKERCPHHMCEIMNSVRMERICSQCPQLLRQIIRMVRKSKSCLDCQKLLQRIIKSVNKTENCLRCCQQLHKIIKRSQQKEQLL